ncbi:MAG TPA: DUF3093 domain-containing protein [Mycobacteriales bacterium]|nr:DUF3093 domain-containing protein [Mycobacteriales bacterium]
MSAACATLVGMADYDERLRVPLWWWPVAAGLVALLGAEVHVGLPLWVKVTTYTVLGGAVGGFLLAYGHLRIRVAESCFTAGRARIPLWAIGTVRLLAADATRRRLGPQADPTAYLATRPWVPTAVEVQVVDDADPTPYWLVSTRHPQELVAAIEAARGGASSSGADGPGERGREVAAPGDADPTR